MSAPDLKTPVLIIPANASVRYNAPGVFVMNINSTASPGDLKVSLGDGGNRLRFDQGDKHRAGQGESFDFIEIYNTSGNSRTATIAIGNGDSDTAQQVTISGNVSVQNAAGQSLATKEQGAATLVDADDVEVAAGATVKVLDAGGRRAALISNLFANGTVVRVGTSDAGAARGAEIGIGATATLETAAEIYVYNPSAWTIDIGVLEVIN
jgi:hypothetical protein